MTRRRSLEREIALGWEVASDGSGLRRLTAECADERTEIILAGPPLFEESDMETALAGDLGRLLVDEHRARCVSCRRWEAAA